MPYDQNLFTCENRIVSPHPVLGANVWQAYVPPINGAGDYLYYDLQAGFDWARAQPFFGRFKVATAFTGGSGNKIVFCIFGDVTPNATNLVANATQTVIARSTEFAAAQLTLNTEIVVAAPPLNSLSAALANTLQGGEGAGFRYLFLGYQIQVPTADFTTAGITAWLDEYATGAYPAAHAVAW